MFKLSPLAKLSRWIGIGLLVCFLSVAIQVADRTSADSATDDQLSDRLSPSTTLISASHQPSLDRSPLPSAQVRTYQPTATQVVPQAATTTAGSYSGYCLDSAL